ncbi:sulfate adenylyltransferase subunit 1 [Amycolatopsis mediterranei S699]|uniref:sulfate adenylyltransferase n=2 Tax=Amycolatopsis mediterranei TaxID=33910 RepID=A0A0H3DCF9_AMYMU|nr:GTP-binding protein [Amycolatopsis mediterranei]ADJ48386.1 sulfate adenylyltransferase subunit 1 [Amycolatopsis mediterranei U32]AEK45307.1 sulfate adenylyltransferase subunit 1 [Amycolatopsis mediterranei S699]AFO80097.1 sulfate adenylyltransferase subunit 1 [Amycolatopsis mediterranei S699]AGT87225.1 sulfate adenylyltransferase subunit 1 [Amycolatopsis mediterranei RB]KDO10905.1 sulfate adenylyltransferase [Amycolatopsis mediterranei]
MSSLLRLATAGSVDDGKSTLVGRLLYDTKSVLADQLDAVTRASVDKGLSTPDLSLLVDGLRSEREQGITIDVAYRYFATPKRSFVLADTPGHVQYTRNTVTGASTAQLAVLLVDARKGVIEQTRRHAAVLALLGVPQLVLAVNKIDLVGYDEATFTVIAEEFAAHALSLGYPRGSVLAIPVSALEGDNVASRSERTPWYTGPSLLEHLEDVPVAPDPHDSALRFPVQYVIRPRTPEYPDYRGYAGQIAAGTVRPGDEIVVLPQGIRSRVERIDTADGPLEEAGAGTSVTLLLTDDIDISRGDLIAAADAPPRVTDEITGTLCWLSSKPLKPGARVLVKHGTRTVQALVDELHARFDEQALSSVAAPASLELNDIGLVTLRLAEELGVDDYGVSPRTGAFLVIDPKDGDTLAAGLVGERFS